MQAAEIELIASHAAEFLPRRFLINGHLQTIMGNYLPRVDALPTAEAQLVEVSPATEDQISSQVLCHCHWQLEEVRAARPSAIIVHGLEGSSGSQYVVGNANKLWLAGCNIIRMNMRNCGGTEALSPTLYHSGLSNDVLAVMNFFVAQHGLRSMSLIGYSMGGILAANLTAKHPDRVLSGALGRPVERSSSGCLPAPVAARREKMPQPLPSICRGGERRVSSPITVASGARSSCSSRTFGGSEARSRCSVSTITAWTRTGTPSVRPLRLKPRIRSTSPRARPAACMMLSR